MFAAALISGLGDGLIPIAFALQSHRIDSSGRGLTMVLIALWAGRFLSSLIVRKLPPPQRPVSWILASDVVRMLAQWLLVLWIITEGESITAFAVSSFVYGCAASFFGPGRFGLLSLLFSDAQRTRVNGTLSMLQDVLFIAGPMIGTAVMLTLGFKTVLILDGATFLIAMTFVLPFLSVCRNVSSGVEQPAQVAQENSVAASDSGQEQGSVDSGTADQISTGGATASEMQRGVSLPQWIQIGLGTWLVGAIANGFLGSAGPTWIMNTFDEKTWGFMATGLAVGSLLGSAATILKVLDRVRFSTLQMLMLLLLAGQVLTLAFSPLFAIIAVVGASASMLMASAGIAWDSLGQSLGSDDLVHQFATKDQLVFTAGTPTGMVLFAALSGHPSIAAVVLAVALLCAAAVSSLPRARSPRTADLNET